MNRSIKGEGPGLREIKPGGMRAMRNKITHLALGGTATAFYTERVTNQGEITSFSVR